MAVAFATTLAASLPTTADVNRMSEDFGIPVISLQDSGGPSEYAVENNGVSPVKIETLVGCLHKPGRFPVKPGKHPPAVRDQQDASAGRKQRQIQGGTGKRLFDQISHADFVSVVAEGMRYPPALNADK